MTVRFVMLFAAVLLLFPCQGTAQELFFPESVQEDYDTGFDLNESKDYLKAFGVLKKTNQEMADILSQRGKTVAALDDAKFLYLYWAAKKSWGEVAYKLGLYKEMDACYAELMVALKAHPLVNQSVYRSCLADAERIKGNSSFLKDNLTDAEASLLMSLSHKSQDFEFVDAVRDDLAQVYYKQGLYEKAIAQLDTILGSPRFRANVRVRGDDSNRQNVLSQRALCLARIGKYDEAYGEMKPILNYYKQHRDDRGRAEALRKTAKMLMLKYDETGIFDHQALVYYKDYLSLSRKYIDHNFIRMTASEREQYWLAEQPFSTDCYRLGAKDASFLYDVALFSKAILLQMNKQFKSNMSLSEKKQVLSSIRVTWQQVKKSMPRNSVAIEFVAYEKRGKAYLGALVLKKEGMAPEFVEIASKDSLMNFSLDDSMTLKYALSANEPEVKNNIYQSSKLRDAIWNPSLVKAIGKSQSVYFAADDLLHLLAIEYLLPKALEGKDFYRMTSTRLLTNPHRKLQTEKVLFCGGVDYELSNNEVAGTSNDKVAYYKMSEDGIGLPYLPGSLQEVDSISVLRNNSKDSILIGTQPSECTLRQLLGKYPVIHLATHGYFSDSNNRRTELVPVTSDEQLSNSCLFFAGSESNMNSRNFIPDNYDGILSARELAEQDLSKVNLVILSACQSGLGYICTDGIYGLQRGLKTAGVKAIIASLWSVDDQATVLLMKKFYENLAQGMRLQEAFSNARWYLKSTTIQKRYHRAQLPDLVVEKKYDEPQYSDAFILIDGYE